MAYLLDANVFIAAKNLHYGLDFCPAFWEWQIRAHESGNLFSIEKVGDELDAGSDELTAWAAARGDEFFLKPDSKTLPALSAVASWVASQRNFSSAAKNTFLQIADYYVVAQALAGGHTVVTHEAPRNSVNTVKIPSVCLGMGVNYMTPFAMLRREQAKFVLGSEAA